MSNAAYKALDDKRDAKVKQINAMEEDYWPKKKAD